MGEPSDDTTLSPVCMEQVLGLPAAPEVRFVSTKMEANATALPFLGSIAAAKNKTDL